MNKKNDQENLLSTKKDLRDEGYFLDKKYGLGWIKHVESGHKKPITRRDFLSHALNASVSAAVVPSVYSLLTQRVYGQELSCQGVGAGGLNVKFLYISVAGGTPFTTQVVCGGSGGQTDFLTGTNAYQQFSLPDAENYNVAAIRDAIRTDLGLKFHPNSSMYLNIVNATTGLNTADMRRQLDGATFAVSSRSDTGANLMDPLGALTHFGFTGALAGAIGTEDGPGGRHQPMRGIPAGTAKTIQVRDTTMARNLGGYGDLFKIVADPEKGKQFAERTLQALSKVSEQTRLEFANMTPDRFADLIVKCSHEISVTRPASFQPDNIVGQNIFDGTDPQLTAAFNTGTVDDSDRRTALICRMLYEGFTGSGVVVVGGGDNHANQAAIAPSQKLAEIGRLVGKACKYFNLRNSQPGATPQHLVLILDSDGGMSFNQDAGRIWQDAGGGNHFGAPGDADRNVSIMMVYGPQIDNTQNNLFRNNTSVRLSVGGDPRRQLGGFDTNGNPVPDTVFSNDPSNLGAVITLNALALFGRESELPQITGGRQLFSRGDAERYLLFNKLFG